MVEILGRIGAAVRGKRKRGVVGWIVFVVLTIVGIAAILGLAFVALLAWQGHRKPMGTPQYVAFGSSFAAGPGLGDQVAGSPLVCQRTTNGYPEQLARARGLSLVNMTCSGAQTTHILRGGQVFQGPQIDALSAETELVTITSGGNDVSYAGDLIFTAGRNASSVMGWGLRHFWKGPLAPEQRDYRTAEADFLATLQEVRRRAPRAKIVVATYPVILPPQGTCPKLSLDAEQVATMRLVGERLARLTRSAARAGGAIIVDMQQLGIGHDACSADPWVDGALDVEGVAFHPNLAGATATARAIAKAMDQAK